MLSVPLLVAKSGCVGMGLDFAVFRRIFKSVIMSVWPYS